MSSEPTHSRRYQAIVALVILVVIGGWAVVTRIAKFRDPWATGSVEAPNLGLPDATTPSAVSERRESAAESPDAGAIDRSAAVDHTVRDRAMHDDVRARILAAWAATSNRAPANGASGGAVDDASAPSSHLDPTYIRSLIRDEFLPMARDCYDQQLARTHDAAGRMTLRFVIMADEHSGGIVDDVQSEDADAGQFDEAFGTCMRETMRTMVFRAPEGGGRITVRYPFLFARGDGGS